MVIGSLAVTSVLGAGCGALVVLFIAYTGKRTKLHITKWKQYDTTVLFIFWRSGPLRLVCKVAGTVTLRPAEKDHKALCRWETMDFEGNRLQYGYTSNLPDAKRAVEESIQAYRKTLYDAQAFAGQ